MNRKYANASYPQPNMKVGRNDPCQCGSGKKYKKCCMDKQNLNQNTAQIWKINDRHVK